MASDDPFAMLSGLLVAAEESEETEEEKDEEDHDAVGLDPFGWNVGNDEADEDATEPTPTPTPTPAAPLAPVAPVDDDPFAALSGLLDDV